MLGNGQPATKECRCSRPNCQETGVAPEARKGSIFSVFKADSENSAGSPEKGFCFGGKWFCSKDCLEWAMGEEIGHLYRHSTGGTQLSRARLGTILRAKGTISSEQLEEALHRQDEEGSKLGQCLIELNYISEDQLVTCLAEQLKIPWIQDLAHANEKALEALPPYLCKEFNLLPLEYHDRNRLVLAVDYSFSSETVQMIGDVLDCSVRLFLARSDTLKELIEERYGPQLDGGIEVVPLGGDLSLSVGHCFVKKWFDVGAVKARFGLLGDLLWIRYDKSGEFFDYLALLESDTQEKDPAQDAFKSETPASQLGLFEETPTPES